MDRRHMMLSPLVIITLLVTSHAAQAARAKTAVRPSVELRDDFEKSLNWTFTCRGVGTQELSKDLFHGGIRALRSTTSRFELMNHRTDIQIRERQSRLSFWCYLDYQEGDEFWTRLLVGVDVSAGTRWLTVLPPAPRQWIRMEILLEDISPALAGAVLTGLHLGLRGRGTDLTLYLDDIILENNLPDSVRATHRTPIAPPAVSPGPLAWLGRDKFRAFYVVPSRDPAAAYRDLFPAPLNAVLLGSLEAETVVDWASRCASYGKHLYLVTAAFPPLSSLPNPLGYRRAQFADTIPDEVVCPQDARYWESGVGEMLQSIAALARLVQIEGCLLDLRMPETKHQRYSSVESCLCDVCFESFLKDQNSLERAAFIPLFERRAFLVDRQWLDDYALWQEQAMEGIARNLAVRLREKHPSLVLGIFSYEDFWLARGMVRGFCSTGLPAIAVSADPARTEGYNRAIREMTSRLRQLSPMALFVPGLDSDRSGTPALSTQLQLSAGAADGFWVIAPPAGDRDRISTITQAVRESIGPPSKPQATVPKAATRPARR